MAVKTAAPTPGKDSEKALQKQREGRLGPKPSLTSAHASRNTVAVLPFADHSQSRDLEDPCEGLTQELIHRLTPLQSLRVIAVDSHDPGSRREAGMTLSGSVRRSGDTVHVTTHLVDTATGSYRWSESMHAPLRDSLDTQHAIATAIID